ncbi:MAG: hypothetical protein ABIV06_11540 [Thermoanaerobaculia bacterium]
MSDSSSDLRPADSARRPTLGLDALVSAADELGGVRRRDLAPGDRLLVSTKNSIYSLVFRVDGCFEISGGRFARDPQTGSCTQTLAVHGCSAGGHALFTTIVAAPGLFLELGDGTRTTRIRKVRLIPAKPGGKTENPWGDVQ